MLVGAATHAGLAGRTCSAVLKWNHGELPVVSEASVVDVDVLGADLGLDKPVVAFQVKKSAGDALTTYQIYSLDKPPRLLRSITGGGYFNAADVDLEGRISIWTSDAAAINGLDGPGLDGVAFADFDSPPTVVLRFERGKLLDVSAEFRSHIDQQIVHLRSQLNAQDLRNFISSDGKLLRTSLPAEGLSRLRKTKVKVLEIVWAYLYSHREQKAWSELAEAWPAADIDRIRALMLAAHAHGILAQTEGTSDENPPVRKSRHAEVFPTNRGDSVHLQLQSVWFGQDPLIPTADTRPQAILLRLPASPKDGQNEPVSEEFVKVVVDAAGKVRSATMVEPKVDDALIRSSKVWKFIPAFRLGKPVACHDLIGVLLSQ